MNNVFGLKNLFKLFIILFFLLFKYLGYLFEKKTIANFKDSKEYGKGKRSIALVF